MFIYRNFDFCKEDGYTAFMTPMVWMFIKNYEKLRKYIIDTKSIISLIELEYLALWEIEAYVPACTFVLSNQNYNSNYNGSYLKLTEYKGGLEVQNKKVRNSLKYDVDYKFTQKNSDFKNIPGNPIAYWIPKNFIESFKFPPLKKFSEVITGMTTGNNNLYLRLWFEVNYNNIKFNGKNMDEINLNETYWIPYNKGGDRRNWFGNNEYIVNWSKHEEFNRPKSTLKHLYLKKGLTWSFITSSKFSMRYFPEGFLWDVSGSPAFFDNDKIMYYCLGFLCSNFANLILNLLNPTINLQAVDLKKVPIIYNPEYEDEVIRLVKNNIKISLEDWNEVETAWDFKTHPLTIFINNNLIEKSFFNFKNFKIEQFNLLKSNEIKLNKIFSEIYSINFETDVDNKYISINIPSHETIINSLVSYAVGCMFGRYSLDNEGLQFAGGEFNPNNYSKFKPDDDNIIPVLDTAYFDDDIVGYFTKFVETCFGSETLEENLDYIAGALSNSNKPSREIIRDYLVKNFFNDHKKTYKKCPIYWQFTSGKQNGFNCLVYMHRYEPSLVARIRTDYLHKTQKAIEQRIENNNNIINNSSSKQDVARATKEKAKLQKQLKETQEYDEVLAHIANQNIEIDLDDGVKVNYAKFQNIEIKKEGSKTKKVNLLKKI